MPTEEMVRSVTRAMQVLRVLQRLGKATLADVQRETGLPKATLLRLMRTLEQERAVWRAEGDGLWRPAVEFVPTRILTLQHQQLIAAAMPALEALRALVVWPSDLAVKDGVCMRLLETTRRNSGLAVNRDEIGHTIDLLRSAVGRAYVAHCPSDERVRLARQLGRRLHVGAESVAREMELIRQSVHKKGYAERDSSFGGHDEAIERFDDQLSAIAVPVMHGARVIACINVVWLKRFDARGDVVARHLKQLQGAASNIAANWASRQRVV
ncbi:helix-turn-helix domain-containing protein [Variovorax sp. RA8]|uniref:helix-turn-helix domain-containing protein n=1 Tax=Variovorax sp. (strain JCM 16519 / RA8) TaxID=662548 RepID=UPI00131864CD|nr:helix-turn-helix domain-containing protein [Variovorax sp. RA8]VTU41620.1 DNA-binding transcriptional activator MhpR [Variovorax sp. RA8]